jgi:hypothetical protein
MPSLLVEAGGSSGVDDSFPVARGRIAVFVSTGFKTVPDVAGEGCELSGDVESRSIEVYAMGAAIMGI